MSFLPAGAEGYQSDESDDFRFGDEPDFDESDFQLTSSDDGFNNSPRLYGDEGNHRDKVWPAQRTPPSFRNPTAIRRDKKGSPLITQDMKTSVCSGNLKEVQNLLHRGVKVDTILSGGWTALMYSVYSGQIEVASYLLQQGADVDFCSAEGMYCPLLSCCTSKANEEKQLQCLDLLLQSGVSVDVHEGNHMTPLMFASQSGHVKVVSKLLLAKSDPNKQDNRGFTALCYAALRGDAKLVKVFLENGADPTKACSEGTASDIAYGQGFIEVSEMLDPSQNPSEGIHASNVTHEEKTDLPRPTTQMSSTSYRTYNDLDLFLCGLDLADLIPLFHSHKVDFAELLRLTEDDLEKMGVQQFGSRRKIMRSVHEIHKLKWERGSLRKPSSNVLSQQESLAILDNVSRHLSYVNSCLEYMHTNWARHGTLTDPQQDGITLGHLSDLTDKLLLSTPKLHNSVTILKGDVKKACKCAGAVAADLITDPDSQSGLLSRFSWILFILSGAVVASAALYKWYPEPFTLPSR